MSVIIYLFLFVFMNQSSEEADPLLLAVLSSTFTEDLIFNQVWDSKVGVGLGCIQV